MRSRRRFICLGIIGLVVLNGCAAGRYQVVAIPGKIDVFLLDTTNGDLYRDGLADNWVRVRSGMKVLKERD